MLGTFTAAWPDTWNDIWIPLRDNEEAPDELLPDLIREFIKALPDPAAAAPIATGDVAMEVPNPAAPSLMAMSDRKLAEDFIRETKSEAFRSERHLIRFFEEAHFIIEEYDSGDLTDLYAELVSQFIRRYNLRYRLLRPFQLIPHIPGVFSGLVERVSEAAALDEDLAELMVAVEQTFEDLTTRTRPADIKTCIAKVCCLTEGLATRFPGVTAGTLGEATKEMNCWPHATIKNSLSALYGFCCDYPAIRHAGKRKSKLRELEVRDALIVSMLFFSFSGYLLDVDYSEVLAVKEAF